ncbi:MAG TPA: hypothetical protein VIM47_01005 [Dermatophilaceae bacterium]
MDPGTGRLYASLSEAQIAGVTNAVQLFGRHEDIERISTAVASMWTREQKAARNAKNKAARTARRSNR